MRARIYIHTLYSVHTFLFGTTNLIVSRNGKVAALIYCSFQKKILTQTRSGGIKSWGGDVNVPLSIVGVLIPACRVTRERPSGLLIGWTFSRKALRGCIRDAEKLGRTASFSGLVLLRVLYEYASYDSNTFKFEISLGIPPYFWYTLVGNISNMRFICYKKCSI